MAPKIIVVVLFNGNIESLTKTLDSIYAQKVTSFEVLVFGDEGNFETLRHIPEKFLRKENFDYIQLNRSTPTKFNSAIFLSKCDFLLFLLPECVLYPDALSYLITPSRANIDCIFGDVVTYNPETKNVVTNNYGKIDLKNFKTYKSVNPIHISSAIISRKFLINNEGFNEVYLDSFDLEFWNSILNKCRIIKINKKIIIDSRNYPPTVLYPNTPSENRIKSLGDRISISLSGTYTFLKKPIEEHGLGSIVATLSRDNVDVLVESDKLSVSELDKYLLYLVDPLKISLGFINSLHPVHDNYYAITSWGALGESDSVEAPESLDKKYINYIDNLGGLIVSNTLRICILDFIKEDEESVYPYVHIISNISKNYISATIVCFHDIELVHACKDFKNINFEFLENDYLDYLKSKNLTAIIHLPQITKFEENYRHFLYAAAIEVPYISGYYLGQLNYFDVNIQNSVNFILDSDFSSCYFYCGFTPKQFIKCLNKLGDIQIREKIIKNAKKYILLNLNDSTVVKKLSLSLKQKIGIKKYTEILTQPILSQELKTDTIELNKNTYIEQDIHHKFDSISYISLNINYLKNYEGHIRVDVIGDNFESSDTLENYQLINGWNNFKMMLSNITGNKITIKITSNVSFFTIGYNRYNSYHGNMRVNGEDKKACLSVRII